MRVKSEIQQQIEALYQRQEEERLSAGARAGNRVEDHQPKMFRGEGGMVMGCTCGEKGKRAARMSMMHVWFKAHVKKLGLPQFFVCDGRPYNKPEGW